MSEPLAGEILAVRRGPGANCSSIGSVVDLLFGAAVVAGVVYAGIAAALADRTIEVVGATSNQSEKIRRDSAEQPDR